MHISAISGTGGYQPAQARFDAANQNPGTRPDSDYAVATPAQRVDGVVSTAAPVKEVAMNLELLKRAMDSQRYVIDLLA